MNRKFLVSALALLAAHTIMGCGTPAAPEPPSLNLPNPVLNLSAARIDDSVHLAWTMPSRTTDRIAIKHPITVQVCRAVESGICAAIANLSLAPGGAGAYTDVLPADLTQNPDRLLRYEVTLRNQAGKSAGPSNPAYNAAGPAPAAVTGLAGQTRGDGVLLSWKPEPGSAVLFRIQRLQLTPSAGGETRKSPLAPTAAPAAQTLAVQEPNGTDPGHAVDPSALFNQRYRYVLERVTGLQLSGQFVEVHGQLSEAIEVATTDLFPPAVPQGLAAVADSVAGAIDLSWSPDSDSDLAAYQVYRRDVQSGAPAQRIASLKVETSFRDTKLQPEHTYAYSVSATDQSGNESKPSTEVEETLPRP